MKTGFAAAAFDASPIVRLLDEATGDAAETGLPGRARAFAEPLLAGQVLGTGEPALDHADAVAAILHAIGAAPALRAAVWLAHAADYLTRPDDVIGKAFGASQAELVANVRRLLQLQRAARGARPGGVRSGAQQTERVRSMLLAFSRDLRVVLMRLASRLQTLRWFAATRQPCPEAVATESLHVFAPLANRLGLGQIKWEMEDLAFRFLQPDAYREVARLLDERRVEREQGVEAFRRRLADDLAAAGIEAEVQGRPKHLYSIWKKMQGKGLDFARVLDVRAVRIVVAGAGTDRGVGGGVGGGIGPGADRDVGDSRGAGRGVGRGVGDCYAALGRVHALFRPVAGEFDDYIERPKPNGYQSLHTVVEDAAGRAVEVQIRTAAMHEHAEHGVAAHWAYKDAGVKGYAGASADPLQSARVAEARKAVLRQLLAWEREVDADDAPAASRDERIYVFTPQAAVVELPAGATPVDFAYTVHTDLGHRCRGARVEGRVVPLNTALQSGQTVEVIAAKEGGPSLDWLNAELGYLKGTRSKAKVRAWFNVLAQNATIARGREAVEKLLQREGKTAVRLDDLAARLGFRGADALFEVVGKDEFSLRTIEALLRPAEVPPTPDEAIALRRPSVVDAPGPKGGVLVVGVESLMTNLAHCCRPAPPDAIGGYVTRGRGVAVHRLDCSNYREMAGRSPERAIPVAWGAPRGDRPVMYPVDVRVEAADRQGLLRDLSELFAKERMNVTGVQTRSVRDSGGGTAWMSFTLEVADAARLGHVLGLAARIDGVRSVRRK